MSSQELTNDTDSDEAELRALMPRSNDTDEESVSEVSSDDIPLDLHPASRKRSRARVSPSLAPATDLYGHNLRYEPRSDSVWPSYEPMTPSEDSNSPVHAPVFEQELTADEGIIGAKQDSYSDWLRDNEFGRRQSADSHDEFLVRARNAVRASKKRRTERVSHPPRDPRRHPETYDDKADYSDLNDVYEDLASNLGPPTCQYERRVVDPIELELEAKRARAERDVLISLLEGILETADSHVQALAFKPKYGRITDAERDWVKTKYDIEEVFEDLETEMEDSVLTATEDSCLEEEELL